MSTFRGYVYILITAIGTRYIGSTKNLAKRIAEHNAGRVLSTRLKRPVRLLGYRVFSDVREAAMWEKKYKRSHGQLDRDMKKGILVVTAESPFRRQ